MPELMFITMQQCTAISTISVKVGNYTVTRINDYMFNNCTCKGFKYRKTCKHLQLAQDGICSWHEMYGKAIETDGVCPECGGKTEYVRVGV